MPVEVNCSRNVNDEALNSEANGVELEQNKGLVVVVPNASSYPGAMVVHIHNAGFTN